MDIKIIPIEELHRDLEESFEDILNCQAALKLGIERYSSGLTANRLLVNKQIVEKIKDELKRRNKALGEK